VDEYNINIRVLDLGAFKELIAKYATENERLLAEIAAKDEVIAVQAKALKEYELHNS